MLDERGNSKRFGFVEFSKICEAERVLRKDVIYLCGEKINFGPAIRKEGNEKIPTSTVEINAVQTKVSNKSKTKCVYKVSKREDSPSSNNSSLKRRLSNNSSPIPLPTLSPSNASLPRFHYNDRYSGSASPQDSISPQRTESSYDADPYLLYLQELGYIPQMSTANTPPMSPAYTPPMVSPVYQNTTIITPASYQNKRLLTPVYQNPSISQDSNYTPPISPPVCYSPPVYQTTQYLEDPAIMYQQVAYQHPPFVYAPFMQQYAPTYPSQSQMVYIPECY